MKTVIKINIKNIKSVTENAEQVNKYKLKLTEKNWKDNKPAQ